MRLIFIGLIILFLGFVVILPRYLAPDELRNCPDQPTLSGDCRKADAIVTVSGGDTTARTYEAIELYKQGWAELIIFSGAAKDPSGPSNALAMKRLAIAEQVPAKAILIEEFSRNTAENAENTSRFIERRNLERVILVTSAYHQRRAGLEFSVQLGQDVNIINHPVPRDAQWGPYWWLRLEGWRLAIGELVKIMYFYSQPSDGFKL